jgi:hypothetical protein
MLAIGGWSQESTLRGRKAHGRFKRLENAFENANEAERQFTITALCSQFF